MNLSQGSGLNHSLFGKTEVTLTGVTLTAANLEQVAAAAARALGLPPDGVWVVNVLPDVVQLDLLAERIDLGQASALTAALLREIGAVPGVTVRPNAAVTGEGILATLGMVPQDLDEMVTRAAAMAAQINASVARRVTIYPTGAEVAAGQIRDTNSPFLAELLAAAGYRLRMGPVLPDDPRAIAGGLVAAIRDGAGWVVTTGGVGAEGKDHTLAALEALDPAAVLAPIATFHHPGVKRPVAIGAAEYEGAYIVALPGPHREVRACGPILLEQMRAGTSKDVLAPLLARTVQGLYAPRS